MNDILIDVYQRSRLETYLVLRGSIELESRVSRWDSRPLPVLPARVSADTESEAASKACDVNGVYVA